MRISNICLGIQEIARLYLKMMTRRLALSSGLVLALAVCISPIFAQTPSGSLQGQVKDERGDVIAGAGIKLIGSGGIERSAKTDGHGSYAITRLASGTYSLRVEARGFAPYETEVGISNGRPTALDVKLMVFIKEEMVIESESGPTTDPDGNASQIVFSGELLNALPSDQASLTAALAAAVGTSAGANGMDVIVDGFTGNRVPPKDLIREIRINRNPFSAEYDHPGFNRVEIFTKPGTETLHGQAFLNISDHRMNSRNPFIEDRAPFQSRQYGGSLSDSLIAKRLSYFLNIERREIGEGLVINATVLDSALNAVSNKKLITTPQHSVTFSPRFDYLINSKSTLSTRYSYSSSNCDNAGLTAFSLPSTAYDTSGSEHALEMTYVTALNARAFDDVRFQFRKASRRDRGDNSAPTINVLEAFTGGGAQGGVALNDSYRWEFANNTSWATGVHSFRVGQRLRYARITDIAPLNFGGTFVFAGGLAPVLDGNNHAVSGADGQISLAPIGSIESYRRTLLFQRQGLSPSTIRLLGGGARQFTISTGNPKAGISQLDWGGFILDEWKLRPNMMLSYGLRFEAQTNINGGLDVGPRIGLIWNPGDAKKGPSKTLIRIGFGIFYDRLGESLGLEVRRYDGFTEQQFIISDNSAAGRAILDAFPTVPSASSLAGLTENRTTRRIQDKLQSPYLMLSGINIERQLPHKIMLVATYANRRRVHDFASRNINAPYESGGRPFDNFGNIFELESGALFKQHQLSLQARYTSSKMMLFASYVWSKAESNSDGPFTFPANSYDLSAEFGRTAQDIRHSFLINGNINLPLGISFSPFITLRSGIPFNITTGSDSNDDGVFADRPAFATDSGKPGVRATSYGLLDPVASAGQEIIPRNLGSGPAFFQLNLRVSKTLGFGISHGNTGAGAGGESKRYKIIFALQAQNLTNRTNLGPVIGNLSSSLFGRANSIFGGYGFGASSNPSYNRRLESQIQFTF